MRTLRRAVKRLLQALGLLLTLTTALLTAFIARPEWFLTSSRVERLARRFGKAYQPSWTSFHFEIVSRSFRDKTVSVRVKDLRFDDPAAGASGLASTAAVTVSFRLGLRPLVRLTRLDSAELDARWLRLDERGPRPAKPARKTVERYVSLPNLLPGPARSMTFGVVDLRARRFVILRSSGSLSGSAWARYPWRSRPQLDAASDVISRSAAGASRWRARAAVTSDVFQKGGLTYLQARADLAGPGSTAKLSARVFQSGPRQTRLRAVAGGRIGGHAFTADLAGSQTPAAYALRGSLAVLAPTPRLRSVSLDDCRLDVPLRKGSLSPRALTLDCQLALAPAPFGPSPNAVPKTIAGRVAFDADVKSYTLEGKPDAFDARLDAALGPMRGWYRFDARLQLQASGRLAALPASLKARHRLSARLRVARFRDLVEFLKGTKYAIPAPLNVLEGSIGASFYGSGDARSPSQTFDYRAGTDLSGAGERLKVSVAGSLLAKRLFEPSRSFFDRTDVDLEEVSVELPYLRLGPLPKVFVDSRIQTGAASRRAVDPVPPPPAEAVAGSTASVVDYDARVFTSSPAVVRSNLAKTPVPVSLRLRARPQAVSGTIAIGRFEAELFRQLAVIDHVILTEHPGASALGLDGLVTYKRPEATIYIHLLGSTSKPQVALSSDPPMTRDEILALLLYGQPPDALDEDQRSNVGNASNGMAAGAFGLASLYLFASTPVEYVGYDPATQTYAVRLKLPGGVHMQLGSSALQESRTLTLRKRLAPHWQIETQAATSQQGNAITTFLEWFERY